MTNLEIVIAVQRDIFIDPVRANGSVVWPEERHGAMDGCPGVDVQGPDPCTFHVVEKPQLRWGRIKSQFKLY